MGTVAHHISDELMTAYAAGSLSQPFCVAIAAHISLCDDCRAAYEAHSAVGGAVLAEIDEITISGDLKDRVLAALDDSFVPEPEFERSDIYPGPVVQLMQRRDVDWKKLGMGVKQDILMDTGEGSVRLLHIPAGQAMPDHGHNGLEMTLVLQGSFSDETGTYGVGDIQVADDELEHTPVAGAGEPCICLAVTDAPLRFNAMIPRLLQPLFKI